jgi:cell division protein FtsB
MGVSRIDVRLTHYYGWGNIQIILAAIGAQQMSKDASLRDNEGFVEISTRSEAGRPRRVVARAQPKPRRSKRYIWRKVVLPALIFCIVASTAILVLTKAARPFMLYDRENSAYQKLEQQVADYRKDNVILERRIKYLQTPEGRAEAARELGWVKPGEKALVLPPEPPAKPKQ